MNRFFGLTVFVWIALATTAAKAELREGDHFSAPCKNSEICSVEVVTDYADNLIIKGMVQYNNSKYRFILSTLIEQNDEKNYYVGKGEIDIAYSRIKTCRYRTKMEVRLQPDGSLKINSYRIANIPPFEPGRKCPEPQLTRFDGTILFKL